MWPLETPSLDMNKFWYECKILWNKIVKGIEILVLKGFIKNIYVKSMIGEWCGILIKHIQYKGEKIFMQTITQIFIAM